MINADASEEVTLPDGTFIQISTDGTETIQFKDGDREIRTSHFKVNLWWDASYQTVSSLTSVLSFQRHFYKNGTIRTIYANGTQETRYPNGRLRIKDKDGNIRVDSMMRSLDHLGRMIS